MVKNSGLGKGLDSLIPDISSEPDEEPLSLEDIIKKDEIEESNNVKKTQEDYNSRESKESKDSREPKNSKESNETKNSKKSKRSRGSKKSKKSKKSQELKKLDKTENLEKNSNIKSMDNPNNKLGNKEDFNKINNKKSSNSSIKESVENSFEVQKDENQENLINELTNEKFTEDKSDENVKTFKNTPEIQKETINNIEKFSEDIQNMEATIKENDVDVLLSEKEEKSLCQVIEIVESNPRITLWSAKAAAVLRYLRKTEPEFSISNEASQLIEDALADKYPEIWTLFDHL